MEPFSVCTDMFLFDKKLIANSHDMLIRADPRSEKKTLVKNHPDTSPGPHMSSVTDKIKQETGNRQH